METGVITVKSPGRGENLNRILQKFLNYCWGSYHISDEGRSWKAWAAYTVPREGGTKPLIPYWDAWINNMSAQLEAPRSFTTQFRCH